MFQPRGHFVLAPVGLVHCVLVSAQQVHSNLTRIVRHSGQGCDSLERFNGATVQRSSVVNLGDLPVGDAQQAVRRRGAVACCAGQVLGYRLQVISK
ncbi:hypothetical protein G6F63_015981 [Rhizopus arrhizus]|nr:hypothetical protein G6F63_015981 [Rhizopus arrhizus]